MALNDIELQKVKQELGAFIDRRRPPPHIRPELDIGFRIDGQSVYVVEIRPQWDNPKKITERPIAKATYVRTQKLWKVFWMRADLKWHSYEPAAQVSSISGFVQAVDKDEYCCFWG